jgi:DNA polymerase III gamma/tau subunit
VTHELYKAHRPRSFKRVVGQPGAVKTLQKYVEDDRVPHCILFTGPSGCGKTTLARILKEKLECNDWDFSEINAAEARGIDTIRDIQQRMRLAAHGKCRVYYIDECQKLTNDAQNALLKTLEDTPEHVYFLLATTDSSKVIKTIQTRACVIQLTGISDKDLVELLKRTCKDEGKEVSDGVLERIAQVSESSARKAMVILDAVINLDNEEDQHKAIANADVKKVAFDLIKVMMPFKGKANWSEVATVLKSIEDEEPEGIRQMVLSIARGQLLKGGPMAGRAFHVINCFRDPFYENKNAGNAYLAAACWDVVNS